MKERDGVWIFRHDGQWFVGVGRGYYARPLPRAEAVRQARQLALSRAEGKRKPPLIKVFGEKGELIEQIA